MVSNKPETLWDDIRDWLTDATRAAIREAEDLSRRGRIKVEIIKLSRRIEKRMAKLGGLTYDRLARDPEAPFTADEPVRRIVREIADLESQLSEQQRLYEEEKSKRRSAES